MKIKKNILRIASVLFIGTAIVSCEKEYDSPPIKTIPIGKLITIGYNNDSTMSSLSEFYQDSVVNAGQLYYTFKDDYSLYATVTMGESTGNIYKETYIQDQFGSPMKLMLTSSSNLLAGDSVRIALKGSTLILDNGDVILDSINPDNNIIKVATERFVTPLEVSLANVGTSHVDRLIKITNCEFDRAAAAGTFAKKGAGGASEYNLVNCDGNSLLVRTSDYCNFASDSIPNGKGYIVGILGIYNTTLQFYIRDPNEISMIAKSCKDSILEEISKNYKLYKDFNDGSLTSGGWTNHWTGDATQNGKEHSGQYYVFASDVAVVKNFDIGTFTNYATVSWLISPAVDLSATTTPVLNFDNTYRYNGKALELYISTDYPGSGDPATIGNWTNITSSAIWNTDDATWTFTNSGNVDITAYKSATTYIAFKYVGTSSSGSTWELDNIGIKEQ